MSRKGWAIIIGIITVTIQNTVAINEVLENPELIKKIISALESKDHHQHDELNQYPKHHQHYKQNDDNHNLLNIQNLNLIIRNRNLRNKQLLSAKKSQNDVKSRNVISGKRDFVEKVKSAARCGCPARPRQYRANIGRCGCGGSFRSSETNIEDIVKLFEDYDGELDPTEQEDILRYIKDKSCDKVARCGCGSLKCGPTNYEDNHKNDNNNDVALTSDNFDNIVKALNLDLSKLNINSGKTNNKVKSKYNINKAQSISNGDMEIIVVDTENIDRLLHQLNLKVSKDGDTDILASSYNNDALAELDSFTASRRLAKEKDVSPEDVMMFYEKIKNEIIGQLVKYIKGKSDKQKLDFLTSEQKHEIDNLKLELNKQNLRDERIISLASDVMFGAGSKMEIRPHSDLKDVIFVPQWLYKSVLSAKYSFNGLRAMKRLLPLTTKQRNRIMQKKQQEKKKSKTRRNTNGIPQYGVPVEINMSGLGQVQHS